MKQPSIDEMKKMTPEQITQVVKEAVEKARNHVLARKLGVLK